ncbi:MAG TPA: DUF5777 family beta-barrel protein [Ignavibacteriales bacterium]|nr:DUF5777 family beta-barrel protein [Ignavibacteriales bacterium]
MKYKLALIFLSVLLLSACLMAQEGKIEWKRTAAAPPQNIHLFPSTQAFSLPTAEMLQRGNLQFEISHRFYPFIKTGYKTFYGLDGPVNMRLALGYAIWDNFTVTLGRSNFNGNVDLRAKYKFLQVPGAFLPVVSAFRLGGAWNTETGERSSTDKRNFQFYGQLIVNTFYRKTLGLGLVPSYLYNSNIFTPETEHSFTMGTYIAGYITHSLGLIFEWNPTISGYRLKANPVAFGIEINTGGHFFKILLTNSTLMNPSQYLAGAPDAVKDNSWRLGFNITRLFGFLR